MLFALSGKAFDGSDHEQFWPKKCHVTIVIHPQDMVWSLGQGISLSHSLAQMVVQGEVELGQIEGPSGLPLVELLGRLEILKVFVIHPDLKL